MTLLRGMSSISPLVIVWLLTDKIPNDELGIYLFFSSFSILCSTLFSFGNNVTLAKLGAEKNSASVFVSILLVTLMVGVVIFLLAILLELHYHTSPYYKYFVLIGLMNTPSLLLSYYLTGKGNIVWATILYNFIFYLTLMTQLVLAVDIDLDSIVKYSVMSSVFNVLFCLFLFSVFFNFGDFKNASLTSEHSLYYYRFSFDIFKGNAVSIFLAWFPIFISGLYLIPEDYAYLNIFWRLCQPMLFFLVIVNQMCSRSFAFILNNHGEYEVVQEYKRIRNKLIFISFIMFFFIIFFSTYILQQFGIFDKGIVILFIVVCSGQIINLATGPVLLLLNMIGKSKVVNRSWLITLMIFTVPMSYFIFDKTIQSAVLMMLVSGSLASIISLLYVTQKKEYL